MAQRCFEDIKHENPLIQNVQSRLWKRNKNWLSIITGPTGSGKSWSALSLAEKIDPSFDTSKVVLRPEKFMEKVAEREWGQGDVVVFDEAGAGMSAKAHMTKKNRIIDQVLQTFRRQNIAVIFTVPSKANVDKSVRRLLHTYIETKTIDYVNERNHLKWLEMDYNQKTDKIYYKYPKRRESSGALKKIKTVKMGKPSESLINAYESKRSKFQDKKNNEFLDELQEKMGSSDEDKGKTKTEKIKDYIEENPEASGKEISNKFDTSKSYVYKLKSQS
jgi:type II secretory ATPase GspE/PulE/Tfp pilus assembly ATPase PilB-like protein